MHWHLSNTCQSICRHDTASACLQLLPFLSANVRPWCWEVEGAVWELSAEQRRQSSSEGENKDQKKKTAMYWCVEALLLHNSHRKSHHRRIIVALSLWVLKVVIHHILSCIFLFFFQFLSVLHDFISLLHGQWTKDFALINWMNPSVLNKYVLSLFIFSINCTAVWFGFPTGTRRFICQTSASAHIYLVDGYQQMR